MNILIAYQFCTMGGVETAIKNRIQNMDMEKYHIDLLFFNDFGGKKVFDGIRCQVIIEHDRNKVIELIKERQYEYIFTIDTPEVIELAKQADFKGNCVLEVHTTYKEGLRYLQKVKKEDVSFIIVPSKYQKGLVKQILNTDMKIEILPNSVDNKNFYFSEKQNVLAKRPVLAWVGRIDNHKNWRLFLEICRNINWLDKNTWDFWLVGGMNAEQKESSAFNDMVLQYDLFNCFRWIPYLDYSKMANLYNYVGKSSGGFISTSSNESFGMTLLEAMACKCPVISNDVGALGELVHDGTGLLLNMTEKTGEEIAKDIIAYFNEAEKVRDNMEHAFNISNDCFLDEKIARRFIEIIEEYSFKRV